MTKNDNLTAKYVREILSIVFLTIIAAIMFLPTRFGQAIGWIAGSIGSGLNFYWLYLKVKRSIAVNLQGAQLQSFKGFYLRYLFLTIYSVLVVVLLKPDIIIFGLGLVSVQIVIYLHYFIGLLRTGQREKEDEN
ncbi:MAG: ATP synthase subunit I [Candidatus Cloacimonetes bacterium]|nr:ATP synthase subunit I [Candidatus Cloacimonadota bacterium]